MPNRILIPLIVACALFMENLDSTVLATSLPAMAQDFGVSPVHLKLALTSYLISLAIFIPASGWLADRLGARLVFRAAIAIFVAGSIMSGLSHSIGAIVFSRITQGLGGSMMVPVGRLVILRIVSKAELVGALSWLTVPALIGPVLGPPVGGFITTYFAWRWIFWINVPVGILGLILATLFIPDVHGDERTAFDWTGFALSGLGLAMLMAGSTTLGLGMLPPLGVVLLLVSGAALLAAYFVHSRQPGVKPIMDLTLIRIPTFGRSLTGGLLFRIGVGATPFLLPLLLQVGFGFSPFHSGLITFASAIGAMAMKFTAPPLLRRYGFRIVLLSNTAIGATFLALPAVFSAATPVWLMTGLLLASGFFRSLQFTSVNALSFADVPSAKMSRATTLTSVAQQLSLSLGISLGALTLEVASDTSGGVITAAAFPPAFLVIAAVSLTALLPLSRLARDAGDEMSGRQSATPDPVTVMRDRT